MLNIEMGWLSGEEGEEAEVANGDIPIGICYLLRVHSTHEEEHESG